MTDHFTIGISNLNQFDFIKIINQLEINVIFDVRYNAISQYNTGFNENYLKEALKPYRIYYRHYPELGEKTKNINYYDNEQILNFKWYTTSTTFKNSIEKINNSLKLNLLPCLLGYSADPMYCHRAIMIGKYLYDNNYSINHLTTLNGKFKEIQTQGDITNRLLELYKLEKNNKNIEFAYKQMNKAIGNKYKSTAVNLNLPLYLYNGD